ncbi:MAG: hypothetical protein Q9201_004105 [Fulgogasparrea decipioides]
MDVPLNLTFGVEMELVIRYDPRRYRPYLESGEGVFWKASQKLSTSAKLNNLVRADIIQVLRTIGVPVHGILDRRTEEDRYSKWTVQHDSSIAPHKDVLRPEWAGSAYTGVEITTPILVFEPRAFFQLFEVINILEQNFSILTNVTCGTHVHVGNGTKGFPVTAVKNFMLLVTAFERHFNSLHPSHRINNKYCRPPGRAWPHAEPDFIAAAIENPEEMDDLVLKVNVVHNVMERNHAYNLNNLGHDNEGKWLSQTIEFRQHEGTFDPMAIMQWTRLCLELVNGSYDSGDLGMFDFVQNYLYSGKFSVTDLFGKLGLDDSAQYYSGTKIYQHPRAEWQWRDPLAFASGILCN